MRLSAEMLDLAREQIAQKGLGRRIRLIHCPIQDLKHQVTGTFDLVLCHAVLEWLAEPRQTLLGLFLLASRQGHTVAAFTIVTASCSRAWWWAILTICACLRKKRQTALTPPIPSCRSRSMTG